MANTPPPREGSVEAPTRHPVDWRSDAYWDRQSLEGELARVFDVCHGCRLCFNLCESFPRLFDAVDATAGGEVSELGRHDCDAVIEHCYLCDMCFMSKCPYVPPHPWQIDFPHLMLRAKAQRFRRRGAPLRDRLLSSPRTVGRIAGIPVVAQAVNAATGNRAARGLLEKTLGVHSEAPLPRFEPRPLRRRERRRVEHEAAGAATETTRGRVVLFATCYGDRHRPDLGEDLIAVFEHNDIPVRLAAAEWCCGMPKLEIGNLDAVARLKERNVPMLAAQVEAGWDIVAPVPSCVLMFKQQLPLMFPDDAAVACVRDAVYDPFEYLMLRHRAGSLRTDFARSLGRIAYHVPCHLRVQNIGLKTRDVLQLVPGTQVEPIERCSGHNGLYALRRESFDAAARITKPVADRVKRAAPDYFASDCPMAGEQVAARLGDGSRPEHPLRLLRIAYGLAPP